jgi:hypothetical protein
MLVCMLLLMLLYGIFQIFYLGTMIFYMMKVLLCQHFCPIIGTAKNKLAG